MNQFIFLDRSPLASTVAAPPTRSRAVFLAYGQHVEYAGYCSYQASGDAAVSVCLKFGHIVLSVFGTGGSREG